MSTATVHARGNLAAVRDILALIVLPHLREVRKDVDERTILESEASDVLPILNALEPVPIVVPAPAPLDRIEAVA